MRLLTIDLRRRWTWRREAGPIGHTGASEKMGSMDSAVRCRSAVGSAPLGRWATRSFVRGAAAFLGQSMLFAGSVGRMLAVVGVLLRLF